MEFGLSGRTALVTGSSRGLGRACAEELAREGADVAICARGEKELRRAADEIKEGTRAEVLPVAADVTDAGDVERLVAETEDDLGPVDVLVANAGGPPSGEFTEFDDSDWRDAFELNLLSSVRLARAVIDGMADRGWGRVIFVTSISVKKPIEGLVLSNSMRSGVTGLAKTLSNRYASEGVTVNCALPGYTLTRRMEDLFSSDAEERGLTLEERLAEVAAEVPAGRLAEPEEFAAAVAFLASGRASYVNGVSLQVDGGYADQPI